MKKRLLLKKPEKDYFTSAQIILTSPFFFIIQRLRSFLPHYLAIFETTAAGAIYTKGNWRERERQNGRDEMNENPFPLSFSMRFPHEGGRYVRVCVCLCEWGPRLNESGAEKNERKNIIIIKVSPTVLGPMAETSSCFNFRSYRSIGVFWPSCNELATSLPYIVNSVLYMSSYNIMRRDLDCWHSLRCVGVDRTQHRPFQFP